MMRPRQRLIDQVVMITIALAAAAFWWVVWSWVTR